VYAYGTWLDRLERDHDNFPAALDWMAEQNRADEALRLGQLLSRFWSARGYAAEGRERFERLLAMPGVSATARVTGLRGVLHSAWAQGDHRAQYRLADELLAVSTEIGDMSGVVLALHELGLSAWHQRRYIDARELLEQHITVSRSHGLRPSLAATI
jgi:hypothetical protein